MKKTALTQLIEQWNKELQEPLGVVENHKAYHVNDVKRATREFCEIKKRIDQATELLKTERENQEHAFNESRMTHPMIGFKHETFEEYYKDTYE